MNTIEQLKKNLDSSIQDKNELLADDESHRLFPDALKNCRQPIQT